MDLLGAVMDQHKRDTVYLCLFLIVCLFLAYIGVIKEYTPYYVPRRTVILGVE